MMFKNQVKIFLGVLVASTVRAIPDGAGECPGCEFGSSGFCQNDGNICIAPDGYVEMGGVNSRKLNIVYYTLDLSLQSVSLHGRHGPPLY